MITPPTPLNSPRRILVRGVNWLGDAVMTTPALLRLRERLPAAHITLLGPAKLNDVWRHHPSVDETISFQSGEGVFSIAKKLRAGRFDIALIFPNSPRSAMEVFFAGIPQRIGYARPWRNIFLTQTVPSRTGAVKMQKRSEAEIHSLIAGQCIATSHQPPATSNFLAHQTHEYLQLAAALGANSDPLPPQLVVTSDELQATKEKYGLADTTRPIFALNPGAEYGPAKRWPIEKFITVAQAIQKQTNCTWLIFGGKGDMELAGRITQEIQRPATSNQSLNLAGQTSLRELMALLKLCRVLLSNDTGPTHVAAALGTPVVVPFGSTSPELTAPGLPGDPGHQFLRADVPCAPCFLRDCPIDFRCMNGIRSERVVEAVLKAYR